MVHPTTPAGKILKKADPSTIRDKFLVGYQGWFTCAGDGEPVGPGHHGWLHWFNYPIPDGGRPNTDLWPDVSEYSPSELFPAPGLKFQSGEQAFLFSSRNPRTVQRHFNWMAQHGVDGAFLQRFVGQCDLEGGNHGIRRIRDEVGAHVRKAAEKEGRVFAIMYDVAGVAPDRVQGVIEADWIHLIREEGILDSPNYLREKGKPVISLWGFGMNGANHSPDVVRAIVSFIRSATPGGAYIIAGTPAYWRTASDDADREPGFLEVWLNEFDAISPWTIGRYCTEDDADHFSSTKQKGDVELLNKRAEEGYKKVDYIPVILPGGSGFNLSEGNWKWNDIKRNGGKFLWKQIFNVKRLDGVRTVYGAMWDEYDEGTAFMPVVENKRMLPVSEKYNFMALDEDGYDLPSDWYMRICGFAAEGLRSERMIHETFPSKELQDYWSTRPRYKDIPGGPSGSNEEGKGQEEYQKWLAVQKDNKDELPPPPYSLEEAEQAAASDSQHTRVSSSVPEPSATQPIATPASSVPEATIADLTGDFARQTISASPVPHASSSASSTGHAYGVESARMTSYAATHDAPSSSPYDYHPRPPSFANSSPSAVHNTYSNHYPPAGADLSRVSSHASAYGGRSDSPPNLAGVGAALNRTPSHMLVQGGPPLPLTSSYPGMLPVHSAEPPQPQPSSTSSYHYLGSAAALNHDQRPSTALNYGQQHSGAASPPHGPPSISPPPLHPSHLGPGPRPNLPPRPSARPASQSPSRPGGSLPPLSQTSSPAQSPQWPPPEWGTNPPPPHQVPYQPYQSDRPGHEPFTSSYPVQTSIGGANLSRPQTYSASSGSSLRPPHAPPRPSSAGRPTTPQSPPSPSFPSSYSSYGPPPVQSSSPGPPTTSSYPGMSFPSASGSSEWGRSSSSYGTSPSSFPQPASDYGPSYSSPAPLIPGPSFPQAGVGGFTVDSSSPFPQPQGYGAYSQNYGSPPAVPPRRDPVPPPVQSSSSGYQPSYLSSAWNAVEGVAGKKTRAQLESHVGNLAQSGTKLFGKFTK